MQSQNDDTLNNESTRNLLPNSETYIIDGCVESELSSRTAWPLERREITGGKHPQEFSKFFRPHDFAKERQVHAVSPMQSQSGRFLNSLLQEAKISSSNKELNAYELETDSKLQQMINDYQAQVLQQQRLPNFSDYDFIRSFTSAACTSNVQQMPPMSHSQPCLINITERKKEIDYRAGESAPPMYAHTSQSVEQAETHGDGTSFKAKFYSLQNFAKLIQEENANLKKQADYWKKKAGRLQQLETAYEKIEKEYENLNTQNEKQSSLEKAARLQMENQIARLSTENEIWRDRVDELAQRLQHASHSDQITKLNLILNEMIPQNNELLACNERQKREIQALEVTLKDQRNHIQILEKALSNAQEKAWKKEKEVEDLTANSERVVSLQKAIERSLMDKQKREEEWSRERAQLEMENAQLKMQLAKESVSVGVKKGSMSRNPDGDEFITKLRKTIHLKDERILALEKSVIELDAKFHEEMQRNKMAITTQSDTLSEKLKKMEEEKGEKDRKIAELTEEKERLMEKLEDERKSSASKMSLLERETEQLRNSDELRENMARMEEMRLKIADRRCLTVDRVRNRLPNHVRNTSNSKNASSHMRASSASALLRSDASISAGISADHSIDLPLDLSSSGSISKSSLTATGAAFGKDELYSSTKRDGCNCRNSQIPLSNCEMDFSDNECLISRFARPGRNINYRHVKRSRENQLKSKEEVWDV